MSPTPRRFKIPTSARNSICLLDRLKSSLKCHFEEALEASAKSEQLIASKNQQFCSAKFDLVEAAN